MSILRYASPEARYYQYDRDIMKDYDNRINIYNTALDKYKTEAGSYQTLVDAHNAKVNQYNTDLENWRNNANAYNEAIAAWNETDRTTPYDEWEGSMSSPGEWVGTAPVFEGGSAPVAPADPGFSGKDVDEFVESAQARATRRGNAAATAQAVMTSPGQFYTVGRDTFGSTPEVSLAGMSGFGSSAMGFEEGGMVPGLAFANSIKPMSMARIPFTEMPGYEGPEKAQLLGPSIQGPGGMSSQDLVPMQMPRPMEGIGGLFQNQFQQYGSQMADMQGSPLKNYQNYLMNTYGSRAMENMQQNVQEDVGEFVGLVDQAERAHFGAEESYGFGGGEYHQGLMDQFQNNLPQPINQLTGGPMAQQYMQQMPQPYQQQQQAQAQFENSALQGLGAAQLFSQGGAVTAITDEDLTAMRNKVINDYGFDPIDIAMEEGVDPELYLRVMYTENRGRQGPVSEAGAIGLMQLMPGTARELGVDPNDPIQNARGGARYLRQQLNTFQTVPLALAAYNAGPGNVQKYGGVPPFEETRNYVAMIHGVDTGEILPDMNAFYTRVEGEDPSPRPRLRPEGLGTPGYVPPEPVQSEYLMAGIGNVFSAQQPAQQAPRRPVIPNIMQKQPEMEEEARGIEFYKQYSAYPGAPVEKG